MLRNYLTHKQAITSDGVDEDLGLGLFLDGLMNKQSAALLDEYNGSYATLTDKEANLTPTERKAMQLMNSVVSLSDAVDYYIETSGKSRDRKFINSAKRSLAFFELTICRCSLLITNSQMRSNML